MAAKVKKSAKVEKKPLWTTDAEYFEWARGEAQSIIRPITFVVNNAGAGKVVDAYHGEQPEDDG